MISVIRPSQLWWGSKIADNPRSQTAVDFSEFLANNFAKTYL